MDGIASTASPEVALLLATYNGEKFVEEQLNSLQQNATRFVIHWLDDQSTDSTPQLVRATAAKLGFPVREWHFEERLGVPGAFFKLIECVSADIYLFCDQDDIWQPGKIDASVADLTPDIARPVLCFTDPFTFSQDVPERLRRVSEISKLKGPVAWRRSSMFVICPAMGHTIGFTRALREVFLKSKDVARTHAAMHDAWLYLLATASGTSRLLTDAPTTLYRVHGRNVTGIYFAHLDWRGIWHFVRRWRLQQSIRRWISRQARGFCLAAETFPAGPQFERTLHLARIIAKLDQRQSLRTLLHLIRMGAMPQSKQFTLLFTAACLYSDAKP